MTKVSDKPGLIDDKTAEIVAMETILQLNDQGYCLWRCALLEGEVIKIVRKVPPAGSPETGYPVYTLAEIDMLDGMSEKELLRLHRLKKASGAELVSVGKKEKEKGNVE